MHSLFQYNVTIVTARRVKTLFHSALDEQQKVKNSL